MYLVVSATCKYTHDGAHTERGAWAVVLVKEEMLQNQMCKSLLQILGPLSKEHKAPVSGDPPARAGAGLCGNSESSHKWTWTARNTFYTFIAYDDTPWATWWYCKEQVSPVDPAKYSNAVISCSVLTGCPQAFRALPRMKRASPHSYAGSTRARKPATGRVVNANKTSGARRRAVWAFGDDVESPTDPLQLCRGTYSQILFYLIRHLSIIQVHPEFLKKSECKM